MYVNNYRVVRLNFWRFNYIIEITKFLWDGYPARPMQRNSQQNLIRAVSNYSN